MYCKISIKFFNPKKQIVKSKVKLILNKNSLSIYNQFLVLF